YWCVVKRTDYKVGDKICFIFPDSLVPRRVWSAFLFPKDDQSFDGPPIRIICRKFKKQISMGLVLPLDILVGLSTENLRVGCSVDSMLEIKKFEKEIPAQLMGTVKGNFPSFLKKTDEINIKSVPDVINEFKKFPVFATIKRDGASFSAYYKDGVFGVCSRNLELKDTENNAYWKAARQLDLENVLKLFGFNVCLQAELEGVGINGNKMGRKDVGLKVFDIFDIDNHKYLDYVKFIEFTNKFNFPSVEVVLYGACPDLDYLIEFANKQKYENGSEAEGIVLRSTTEQYSEVLDGRLSCKIINENFALKYKE
ncbi:MAG: RNA ligase family protein, partial [bacterium]|nr:RNA ligase family protein [bacterium]